MKLFNTVKYNVLTNTVTEVPYPTATALEWAEENGGCENIFLIVDHSFDKKKHPETQVAFENMLKNGIILPQMNVKYVPVMAGSSQERNAFSTWIDANYKESFINWCCCGINDCVNLIINKVYAYRALSMSSIYSWEEALPKTEFFGLMKMPDIRRIGVFKDIEVNYTGVFDLVEEMQTQFGVELTVQYKISDGVGYYIVDDRKLTPNQRYELVKQIECFTFRAPGFKGQLIPILRTSLENWFKMNNISPMKKDIWGNELNILNLHVFTFGSVFKWSKCINAEEWKTYKHNFIQLNHKFSVCVVAHNRKTDMPYQQVQTFQMEIEEGDKLAKAAAHNMYEYYSAEGAAKLLNGPMKDALKEYPSLILDRYFYNEADMAYVSRRHKIAGGRIPAICYDPFAAPDTIAILEGMFSKKIDGVIPGKHVKCRHYNAGEIVDVTRCPHLDNAHCLRYVDETRDVEIGLFPGHTMYFSCKDASMSTMQMDFDGDHVKSTNNKFVVNLAIKSIRKLGNHPLWYEAKGTKASVATEDDAINLLAKIEPAPVGLYANTLTKLYANGVHTSKDLDNIAVGTEGANTCIDAAKYIAGDSVEAAGFRGLKLIDKFNGVKLPMFHAYAKSSPFVKGSFESRVEKSKLYTDNGLETYSQNFLKYTSEHLDIKTEGLVFDYRVLMSHKDASIIPGLMNKAGKGKEEGFFRHLTRRFEIEKNSLQASLTEDDDFDAEAQYQTVVSLKYDEMKDQILQYAGNLGYNAEDVVNCMVLYIYTTSENICQMKRALWNCFGEEIAANIRHNLNDLN